MRQLWSSFQTLSRVRKILILLVVAGNLFALFVLAKESRAGILSVAILDVGQGDAIFIDTPSGNQVLIDAGGTSQVLRSLGAVMPFYDRSLEVVMPTHPDLDHMGGFVSLLDRYRVSANFESGIMTTKGFHRTFEQELSEGGVQKIIARRGMRVWLDEAVVFDVLYPDRDVSSFTTTNDGGVVGMLTYGSSRMLFTADVSKSVERYLISLGDDLHAQVLKVGHHGSHTSTSPELVAAVRPEIAVISSGKGNSYGHPHKETLETLAAANVRVLNTQDKGTIVLVSDGEKFRVK